jgi:hypothetical protein
MSAPRTWTIGFEKQPLTVNAARRTHWANRAKHDRLWRHIGKLAAQNARIGNLDRITVVWTHERRNRAHFPDTAACIPSAKAFLDGIVDALVIKDDSPHYVLAQEFRVEVTGRDALTCTITEVTE